MHTLLDYKKIDPRLMAQMIGWARQAAQAGRADGSTSEQIVKALLNGRTDWLPSTYPTPLDAIDRLVKGGEDWWHSMLAVHERGWRLEPEYESGVL